MTETKRERYSSEEYASIYKKEVAAYWKSFEPIHISEDDYYLAKCFAAIKSPVKIDEDGHKYDNGYEFKRNLNGTLGEIAVGKLLGFEVMDWSVGSSNDYSNPDIPGYKIGVKTAEKGNFIVIFKDNWYPQILCTIKPGLQEKGGERYYLVFIHGMATPEMLNKYQDDRLIKQNSLLEKQTKTCFNGIKYLIKPADIKDRMGRYKTKEKKQEEKQNQKLSVYLNPKNAKTSENAENSENAKSHRKSKEEFRNEVERGIYDDTLRKYGLLEVDDVDKKQGKGRDDGPGGR